MANSTVSLTFKLNADEKSFKALASSADGLKKAMEGTVEQAAKLKVGINFDKVADGINKANQGFSVLYNAMKGLTDAYAAQETAERKLQTVMEQRMGATEEEVQAIKDLTAAQQQLGVIGDEVQLAGAQQVATFLTEKDSLAALIPAMNNLIAQQKGLNATQADATSIGNMLGKAMQGQVDTLKRVGITFTEAEANVMKYGTESERAAMLAQIITNNVGDMNAALAQTDSGKQKQLANAIGDVKEQIGSLAMGAMPFVTIAAQSTQAAATVAKFGASMKAATAAMVAGTRAFVLNTAAAIKNKVATLAVAVAQKVAAAATAAWSAVQTVLNAVMSMNPIGIVITAIGALVAALVVVYNRSETFRNAVDGLFDAIRPLATAIGNSLVKALTWLAEKAKIAWQWLRKLFGAGETVEVEAAVTTTTDTDSLTAKYAGYTPAKKSTATTTGNAKVYREEAETLAEITENISVLQERLNAATIAEAAGINQTIELWQEKADAIRNAGKAADEGPTFDEAADTLESIGANIDILTNQLQTATVAEAASINQAIALWNEKADAIRNAGKAVEEETAAFDAQASTLRGIETNINLLRDALQDADIEEAAAINREIALWQEKADAIKDAGKATESAGAKAMGAVRSGWGGLKSTVSSAQSLTDALSGNGNAWEKLTGIVDGVLGMFDGINAVVSMVNTLTAATHLQTSAETAKAAATTAATSAETVAAAEGTAQTGVAIAQTAANKALAASFLEAAVASFYAAHAYIPFAGAAIASGFAAAATAAVTAAGNVALLASGGIISGPTLAMVGEYAGASNNPEVVAPLDKLQGMISSGGEFPDRLKFEIEGRKLVGVLEKEYNYRGRI